MIHRIKKNYPKYQFIITGDALYATNPIINLCKKYQWNYIFKKPDRLKEINETFEDNINFKKEITHRSYYLSTNIPYKNNLLHVFKYIETKKDRATIFRYISNLDSNDSNSKKIVTLGR